MKYPEDRHEITNIDNRIHEVEELFDESIPYDFDINLLNDKLNELGYLMRNKYYGPFRLQGQSYREQCRERKIRKKLNKVKYTNRQPHNIKED